MAEKQRQLPPWMALQEERVSEKTAAQSSTTASRKTRREHPRRTVFYCMNEKELVEAAIGYLNEDVTGGEHASLHTDQQVNDSATKCHVNTKNGFTKEKRVSELEAIKESSDSDGCERTRVSETDLDITEEETLPYTNTNHLGEQQEAVGLGEGPGQGQSGPVVLRQEGGPPEDCSQPLSITADDALRLVREIFFT